MHSGQVALIFVLFLLASKKQSNKSKITTAPMCRHYFASVMKGNCTLPGEATGSLPFSFLLSF